MQGVDGLDGMAAVAGLEKSIIPQMDATQVSAETLLDVMTAEPSVHPADGTALHQQLADKLGKQNLTTAKALGVYLNEQAKTDVKLRQKMDAIQKRFTPLAVGQKFDFYTTLAKLNQVYDRSIRAASADAVVSNAASGESSRAIPLGKSDPAEKLRLESESLMRQQKDRMMRQRASDLRFRLEHLRLQLQAAEADSRQKYIAYRDKATWNVFGSVRDLAWASDAARHLVDGLKHEIYETEQELATTGY